MHRRGFFTAAVAFIAGILPAKAQTIVAGDAACKLFGRHRWTFDRNEPRNEPPPGWWWEFSKCKCGAELRELVASPRG